MSTFNRLLLICVLYTKVGNSQDPLKAVYNKFNSIDWSAWHKMDTVNCTSNRRAYCSYFDSLFVTGISRDSVEKYLGKGIHISADYMWRGKANPKIAREETF